MSCSALKPAADALSHKTARLLKPVQPIEELTPADPRAVLKVVDAMLDTRRRFMLPSRTNEKSS